MVPKDADINPRRSLWWPRLMTSRTGACTMWLAWNMERVWSMVGLWLCCGRKHMVLVGNDNDKNAGCVGGSGVEDEFRRSSNISPTLCLSMSALSGFHYWSVFLAYLWCNSHSFAIESINFNNKALWADNLTSSVAVDSDFHMHQACPYKKWLK